MADEVKYELGEILITQDEILRRAAEIGRAVSEEFAGEEVLVVGILKGAVLWMSDVVKQISIPVKMDFMAVSSYGAATETSGVARILKDLDTAIEGRNILLVEDIVDSGVTLNFIKENLLSRQPKTLRICALLDKPSGRRTEIQADYTGFTIDDLFIVGYGLDVNQCYRNLPYITSIIQ